MNRMKGNSRRTRGNQKEWDTKIVTVYYKSKHAINCDGTRWTVAIKKQRIVHSSSPSTKWIWIQKHEAKVARKAIHCEYLVVVNENVPSTTNYYEYKH
jgi:hypothetical protein